ncbi:hypothetical protein GCM10027570_28860 [Streptomonospora sediminis]
MPYKERKTLPAVTGGRLRAGAPVPAAGLPRLPCRGTRAGPLGRPGRVSI